MPGWYRGCYHENIPGALDDLTFRNLWGNIDSSRTKQRRNVSKLQLSDSSIGVSLEWLHGELRLYVDKKDLKDGVLHVHRN